jgi:aspartate racemase
MQKIGLLGTRFTMEHDFYKGRLIHNFGLDVLVPNETDRNIIHRVIYEELVQGKILDASREEYKRIIESLIADGAQGIILGCTEIELLVKQNDSRVPLFPTTHIHATAAVEYALK